VLLTPSEVAKIFKVKTPTIRRWAKEGKIRYFKTPGGHRRYLGADIEAFVNSQELTND
jgi:excisionase family DNA binding protein